MTAPVENDDERAPPSVGTATGEGVPSEPEGVPVHTSVASGTMSDFSTVAAEGYGDASPHEHSPEGPRESPSFIVTFPQWVRDYFLGDDPSFGVALVPFCVLAIVLFSRWPTTNFIFDEQEALLANPYVRSIADAQPKFHWVDAFYRDFWGLGPERSIGSYRPIPNLVWRALWGIGARDQSPFLHHFVNLLFHGANGALVCVLAFALTKRRGVAWLAGAIFTTSAVLTEAVSGVVGIADVLGATGALLALLALTLRLRWMVVGVFFGTLFGLYSKESALCCVPMVAVGALLFAPPPASAVEGNMQKWVGIGFSIATALGFAALFALFRQNALVTLVLIVPWTIYRLIRRGAIDSPERWLRGIVAFVAAALAFVLYVTARHRMFPAAIPAELSVEANAHKELGGRVFAAILRWYAQPTLPKDPLNNPLVHADSLHRMGGALRVWFRGLTQVVFPLTLSGDYSAPQEPVPATLLSPEILLGAFALIAPFPLALFLASRAWWRNRKAVAMPDDSGATGAAAASTATDPSLIVAFGVLWVVISFFPVSNIPVLLPTIRAERFWYFPVIATSLMLAVLFGWLVDRVRAQRPMVVRAVVAGSAAVSLIVLWFGFRIALSFFATIPLAALHPLVELAKHIDTGADRFWYLPVLASLILALWVGWFVGRLPARRTEVARGVLAAGVIAFLAFQCLAARRHAADYNDDLTFWDATRKSVPRSAKAHLNYSVMKGARGDLPARLAANGRALELAPDWPMASIYYGDTLCRLHRAPEAWRHYVNGFERAPNDVNLVALGVQCLWDEKLLVEGSNVRSELDAMKEKYPGSWLEYIARDVLEHGEEHNGVDPKYRPRGYNEGPKD